jgi:hypothetical protein
MQQQGAVEAVLTGLCDVMMSAAGGTRLKVLTADVLDTNVLSQR